MAKCCSKETQEEEEAREEEETSSSKWDIINKLPGCHEWQSLKVSNEARKLKLAIAQMEEEQKNITDEDEQEKIQLEINYFQNDLEKLLSKSRIDKSYQAILESGLQYLLQSSIAYEKYGSFGFMAIFDANTSVLNKIQLSTSLLSVFNGFIKMYEELPYQMDGEMTTNKEPIKSTYKELRDESWRSWTWSKVKEGAFKASFLVLICLRFSNLGQKFIMVKPWKSAVVGLALELFGSSLLTGAFSMFEIRRNGIKVLPKARKILYLGYVSCFVCPSVVGVYESGLIHLAAVVPGLLVPLVRFLSLISPNSLNLQVKLYIGCLGGAYLLLAAVFSNAISHMMNIKKRNEIMEKAIQKKSVAKMSTPLSIWVKCCFAKLPILEDSLPNYGMTRLVSCVVSSFHEGAALVLNPEEHIERKMDYESRPTNPYVLLNETNVLTFKGDAEDANELLEEIKSLETLSLHDKQTHLKQLIRPNRYLDKTALMIASEKKDVKMVEILLHQLPPKLLGQTDMNGKNACHYACDNNLNDQELTKEVVRLFLVLSYRQIDLLAKDNAGQTALDYLPSELKTEFASQFPQFFSEV